MLLHTLKKRTLSSIAQSNASSSTKKKVLLGIGMGLGAGFTYRYSTDEGTRRSLKFWSVAFPIFLHYRYVEWMVKGQPDDVATKEFNKLHDQYAPVAEKLTLEMRGFYLKNAQLASTLDDFLPPQYMAWAKKMQSEVPTTIQPEAVRAMIERGLGKSIEEVFSSFQEEPIGCASIGQVHLATLRSNGQKVAVKVQAPGIERQFRADIRTLQDFCRLAMPQHVAPMEEIEKQFATEFDYIGEAENLLEIYQNIMPIYGRSVVIPRPYVEYCSKEVLVMEYLKGKDFITAVKDSFRKLAAMQGKDYEQVEREQIELLKRGQLAMRSVDEEAARMRKYQKLIDTKVTITNVAKMAYNGTIGMVFGKLPYTEYFRIVNLGEIVKTLSEVHGHEIMIDGAFNGDPHPGNALLMEDGRLGLVDYGQVKHLTVEERVNYARMIVALAEDDEDKVWEEIQRFKGKTKHRKKHVQYLLAKFWNDTHSKEVTGGRNIQEFIDWAEAEDPAVDVPHALVMPGRVSFLLRAIGNAFGIDLRMAKLWEPIAREAIRRYPENMHDEITEAEKIERKQIRRRYSSLVTKQHIDRVTTTEES